MSIFKRALGAVGAAGGAMASRYIDEQLAQQRAQFMADLQRTTAAGMREDQEAFDARVAPTRNQRAADATVAQGAATDQVALNRLRNEPLNQAERDKATAGARAVRAAKVEELNDPALQQATDANARRAAERDAGIERDRVKAAAADQDYMKSAERIALSDPKVKAQIEASRAAAANAYASAQQTRAQTESIQRVNSITKEMLAVLNDDKLDDKARADKLSRLQTSLALVGGGGKREDKGDRVTEEIKETIDPKTGEVISKERNTKGPLGAAQQRQGYPEGTELRGPDGKLYVVKGGVPALKDAAAPAPTRKDPLSGQMLTEAEWDRKFGRGDFRRYTDGQPSIQPF